MGKLDWKKSETTLPDTGQSLAYISDSVLVQLHRGHGENPAPCSHRCKTDAFRMQLRVR